MRHLHGHEPAIEWYDPSGKFVCVQIARNNNLTWQCTTCNTPLLGPSLPPNVKFRSNENDLSSAHTIARTLIYPHALMSRMCDTSKKVMGHCTSRLCLVQSSLVRIPDHSSQCTINHNHLNHLTFHLEMHSALGTFPPTTPQHTVLHPLLSDLETQPLPLECHQPTAHEIEHPQTPHHPPKIQQHYLVEHLPLGQLLPRNPKIHYRPVGTLNPSSIERVRSDIGEGKFDHVDPPY